MDTNELQVYIVSSDIFDHFVRRKDIAYRYQQQSCLDKRLDSIRQDICNIREEHCVNRVFINYPLWDMKGEHSNFRGNLILVSHWGLPKLTYRHYKRFTQEEW